MTEVINAMRHKITIGDDTIYLLAGDDGSYLAKFAYENRVEMERTRMYVDAVLEKVSELNRR